MRISHTIGKKFITEKFSPFRLFYRLVKLLNFTKKVKRNGVRISIPIQNGMGLMNLVPDYETWLDELLAKLLDDSSVFIDVGANTGQTILKVKPHFPSLKYYAIEPNPQCITYLNTLCEVNNFESVISLNYALSDTTGETALLLRYQDDLLATTSPSFRKFTRYSSQVVVPMITGDSLIQQQRVSKISAIKIDVEGGEAKVIKGLLDSIHEFQPYIICEILPLISSDQEVTNFRISSAKEIINCMDQLNYEVVNIATKHVVKTIDDLSSSMESSNYLFIPPGAKNPII